MSNNNEMCTGCRSYENDVPCKYIKNDKEVCPCLICLIKGMCNDACEKFRIYNIIPSM